MLSSLWPVTVSGSRDTDVRCTSILILEQSALCSRCTLTSYAVQVCAALYAYYVYSIYPSYLCPCRRHTKPTS